jgi:hypothetical protein
MSLRLPCSCGNVLKVPEQFAGKAVRCPKCKKTLQVPAARTEATEPETPVKTPVKGPAKPPPAAPRPAKSTDKPRPSPPSSKSPPKPKSEPDASSPAPNRTDAKNDKAAGKPPRKSADKTTKPAERDVRSTKPAPPPRPPERKPSPPPIPKKEQPEPTPPDAAPPTPPTAAPPVPPTAAAPSAPPPPPLPATAEKTQTVAEPPPLLPEKPNLPGIETLPDQRWTCYYLAIALALMGLFNMSPGVWDIFQQIKKDAAEDIYFWAYVLLLIGMIQLVYAVYLAQLPDWSSVWVVSLLTLLMAVAYAMLLGLVLLAKEESGVIATLQLADQLRNNHATLWCFMMLSVTSLYTYFSGRAGVRWHQTHVLAYSPGKR